MKSSKGVILLFLALIFKVAVAVNYTKVFLIELEIEKSAYSNVTILTPSTQINMENAIVTKINRTTDCTLNEMQKNCSCMSGYTWGQDICKNHGCCKDKKCLLKAEETAVCLSDKRVSIRGSTKLKEYNCSILCEYKTQDSTYINLSQEIKNLLMTNYSTLPYFDSLIINGFRKGSVIVDYTVQLLGPVSLTQLANLITSLNNTELVTTGFIDIKGPEDQPIDIGSMANISCTPPESLGEVKWFLTNDKNKTTQITTGLEAELKKESLTDIFALKNISGDWQGTFMCMYKQGSIKHTASQELDLALLPEIQAWNNLQFPDCRDKTKTLQCKIECKILNSTENYSIKWDHGLTNQVIETQGKFISYKAVRTINCDSLDETVTVSCTFTNSRSKLNRNKTAILLINIIHDSKVCESDAGWPVAKRNYSASMPCDKSAVGFKTRECKETWQNEISYCVNEDLHDILNDVEVLNKGIGFIKDNAAELFQLIKTSTTSKTFNLFSNINTSLYILDTMNHVSLQQSNQWNDSVMPDLVSSVSNILNDIEAWKNPINEDTSLSVTYLQIIEKMVNNSILSAPVPYNYENVELNLCKSNCSTFNASVETDNNVVIVGFRNLHLIFPQTMNKTATSETTILSVKNVNNTNVTNIYVKMMFEYSNNRLPNHNMYCVFWDEAKNVWSEEGCEWGGADKAQLCQCKHNSAFTILISKTEETLPYMKELTYIGLGISIVSLVLCLIIEILIWDTVVKSDISNFRHVAIFNICLCLLLADCAFLASAEPEKVQQWCLVLTIVKHFFFLAVFFWMLCLSFVILHQIIFVFDHLQKKVYVGLSITLGYVCPILCVGITLITFQNGANGEYYSNKTCWLSYKRTLKGSIFAFVLPVGTIVFINLFTLAVVIMKIVTPTVSEAKAREEKDVAKSLIKTIVFLSPVLGITWIFGICLMDIDLTKKKLAYFMNYTFTILNSLQGFFILLTNCLGEKKVRDALRKRFKVSTYKQPAHSKSESSNKMTSSVMKK